MSVSSSILGGAHDRLLPASIPFRFFLSAVFFHALAWAVLVFGAPDLPGFSGGTGLVLAVIHLLTLGVLTMTAIGAAYQLLPVATRRPLTKTWPARASFWLVLPGVLFLSFGMGAANATALAGGGLLVAAGLLIFVFLTADNLYRAGADLRIVGADGGIALLALVGAVGLALVLIANLRSGFLDNHQALAASHMVLAVFGFMGLMVAGFSQILVPMFALCGALPQRLGWWQLGLSVLGIGGVLAGIELGNTAVSIGAGIIGLMAALTYLWLMRACLKNGMRKRLGLSFLLIRTSWGFLIVGVLIGLLVLAGVPVKNAPALFGFALLGGWLLTFLLGILQRIMPFLASMHISSSGGHAPRLSEIAPDWPLRVHMVCHFLALALIATGISADWPLAVRVGAAFGLVGAISFGVFAGFVAARITRR